MTTANTDGDTVRIYIVRHGQTDHNVVKILQGHTDIDINDTGAKQAELVAQHLQHVPFDILATSDLVRCTHTMDRIVKFHPGVPCMVSADLRERRMGIVEGMYLKDALAKYGEDFRNMGEKKHQLLERVERQWQRILDESRENDYKNCCVCTHGGVITGFVNYLYSSKKYSLAPGLTPEKLKVPFNTSVSVVDVDKKTGEGVIQSFGLTAHLGAQYEVKEQLLR